jgi:hypothetical protein
MPEISARALVVSIQAVDAELCVLREAARSGDLRAEDSALIEEREIAAESLRDAYSELEVTVLNLPPYEQLVRKA